ncbi:toxin-antitoxin system YwqK family antitoxin [Fontibacter flavus]|uniref:Toxin-antitoxin system YwqK family antitoxin n=1 Tax=Fontibacter flavus TaxID=654838 RepID=A0ABV6FXF9_9BACT
MFRKIVIILLLVQISHAALAQKRKKEKAEDPDSTGVVMDRFMPSTLPILLFDDTEKKEKQKKEKKKIKKNIFFGERTKKGRIKQSFRDQTQTQQFHYTYTNKTVDPYIRDIYWFDKKDNVIRTKDFDPSRGYLLHGPYSRSMEETVLEEGNFYFGTKHGIWLSFDNRSVLLDKLHYSEGWPKDSRVSYYNKANNQIEQLTPIEYELKEGNFYHFYEDGQIAVSGEYHYGEKVGLWTEYWNNKSKVIRKREVQYQETPFTKNFRPYIRAEWDKDGNLIYRNEIRAGN